ncbi:MAG: hypothetical protein WC551_09585 [Patescibacteria group bacterium]
MNRRVCIVTEEGDEIFIGTVAEFVEGRTARNSAPGDAPDAIPVASVIADIVAGLFFDPELGEQSTFTVQLR